MTKETIFFDIGNVLVFFDHAKMCRQVATISQMDHDLIVSLMQQYVDPYERGSVNSEEMHRQISEKAHSPVAFDAFMKAMSDIFRPNLPTMEIAQELKKRGHPLFVLSNTCEAHFSYLKHQFPIFKLFDGFVLSYEVKARKPERKIFEKALEIAGCKPYECFYTDDVLDYVESARKLEIDAEQFTTPSRLKEHLAQRGFLSIG